MTAQNQCKVHAIERGIKIWSVRFSDHVKTSIELNILIVNINVCNVSMRSRFYLWLIHSLIFIYLFLGHKFVICVSLLLSWFCQQK